MPSGYENLFWFSAEILVQGQWNCILLTQLCRKIDFFTLLCGFDHNFWLFVRNYRKNYWNPIYRHFSNYQKNYPKFIANLKKLSKNYRYQKLWEIYRKIIDIEKKDLSPTPTNRWRHFFWFTRWRHWHRWKIWPPDRATCIFTLPWMALLA